MLTIKCSKCKNKLFKYEKVGSGRVLRCWKNKITRTYNIKVVEDKLFCAECDNLIGRIDDKKVDMISEAFTYTGTKTTK